MKLRKTIKTSLLTSAMLMGFSSFAMAGGYTVKAGDTLNEIAKSQGMMLNELVKANPQIKDINVIEVGDVINLPGKSCEPTAAYKQAVADANAALDKAKSVKSEWRDSRWKKSKFVKYTTRDGKTVKSSYMGAAAVAAENCDFTAALKFLDTAKFQGEMGYEQGMQQKSAGPVL